VHPRALRHGLAAALLAELLYPQWITIHHGRVVVGARTVPPDDLLGGAPPHAYDDLRHLVDHGWPPIVELARRTRAALGRTVAAHRG
jgi:hypothetical protein